MRRDYLIYYISQIRKRTGAFLDERLAGKGLDLLCPTHGTMLAALYDEDGPLTMKDLAHRISRSKSTTSQLAELLVMGDYAERRTCPEDRRVTHLVLTPKGKAIKPVIDGISKELIETAYAGFTPEEEQELLRLLKKLHGNFKKTEHRG